jgi:hypothetical protein
MQIRLRGWLLHQQQLLCRARPLAQIECTEAPDCPIAPRGGLWSQWCCRGSCLSYHSASMGFAEPGCPEWVVAPARAEPSKVAKEHGAARAVRCVPVGA